MSHETPVNPLPVLLLRRGRVTLRQLGALPDDPRIELYPVAELTPDRVAFAQRVAGVLVATTGDPLAALTYVVTGGVSAPIVVAVTRDHKRGMRDVLAAGATACVAMPISKADVDALVKSLTTHTTASHVDATLRLLLDPIERVVRYQDKSVRLSQREFALLHCLSSRHGRPVPADELLTYVWGEKKAAASRPILDVYIFQLRKKLARVGLRGAISTVRRFGYALVQVPARTR